MNLANLDLVSSQPSYRDWIGNPTIIDTNKDTVMISSEAVLNGFEVLLIVPVPLSNQAFCSFLGSATGGTDYTGPNGSVMLTAGTTSLNICISVNDDGFLEGTKTVVLKLDSLGIGIHPGASISTAADEATIKITDYNAALVKVDSIVLSEGTVQRSSVGTITVHTNSLIPHSSPAPTFELLRRTGEEPVPVGVKFNYTGN